MLIVAMPKTASTSVMVTLGRLSGLPATQEMFPGAPWPRGWHVLPRFHRDMRELDSDLASRFRSRDRIHKQHVVPTENNLERLGGTPLVLLTREPVDIVAAYHRVSEIKATNRSAEHGARPDFDGLDSIEEWQQRADDMGLLAELELFRTRWIDVPEVLEIDFADLTGDPSAAVRRIQAHLGLDVSPGDVELDRMRWTRGSPDDYTTAKGSNSSKAKIGRVLTRLRRRYA